MTFVPLSASVPLVVVLPVPVMAPALQVLALVTVRSCVPAMVPPERFSVLTVTPAVLLKLAVPALTTRLPPVLATVPLKLAVPPLTVVVPATL